MDELPQVIRDLQLQQEKLQRQNEQLRTAHHNQTRELAALAERLQAILNTAADAIVTVDYGGVITSVNPGVERMFGYRAVELLGRNISVLMPAPYCDEHDAYMARYLRTRQTHIIGVGREVVGRHKDGSHFPVGLAISEVEHLQLFTGIMRDIRAMKELQSQVLEIAAAEDRRIGYELHDNVQQQLTGLGLLSSKVAARLSGMREHDARIGPTAELATRVAEGIAEAARQVHLLSRGLIPVSVDAEGLRAALEELAMRVREQFEVRCECHCSPYVMLADTSMATHLYRIAQEAVSNAITHGRAKFIEITLTADRRSITLQVLDDGSGMGDPRTTGSGCGLKIMEYRANLMGATLRVAPNTHGGTRVLCTVGQNPRDLTEVGG